MIRIIDNLKWIEIDGMEQVCRLFAPLDLFTIPRIEPVELEDGTVITIASALKWLATYRIKLACKTQIINGIDSAVLGTTHHYPTDVTDQANLNGLISASLILGIAGAPYKFECADTLGVWQRRAHSLEQIQQLGLAVAAHTISAKNKYELKQAEISAVVLLPSPTLANFDAIVW